MSLPPPETRARAEDDQQAEAETPAPAAEPRAPSSKRAAARSAEARRSKAAPATPRPTRAHRDEVASPSSASSDPVPAEPEADLPPPRSSVTTSVADLPPPSSLSVVSLYRMFGRHRIVTTLGVLATVLGMVLVVFAVPPKYESGGALLLLLPAQPEDTEDTEGPILPVEDPVNSYNPYIAYGNLSVVSDIVARVMMNEAQANELAEQGITGYLVSSSGDYSRGALIEVEVEAATAAEAQQAAEAVLGQVAAVLEEQQARYGTDPEFFITADLIEPAREGTQTLSSTLRALIATAALGGLLTCGAVLAAEGLTEHRRRRELRRELAEDGA